MTDLLGAWSLSNLPAARLLGRPDRDAMVRALAASAEGLSIFASGPLWLCAARDKLVRKEEAGLGVEGFVALGASSWRSLESILDEWASLGGPTGAPEGGGYVCAFADLRRRRLSLLRSLSGGERLYTARLGDLLVFASSIRPLLAHSDLSAELDLAVLDEELINGRVVLGRSTMFRGIDEVPPGQVWTVFEGEIEERLCFPEALTSPRGSIPTLANRFRRALTRAVELAAGPDRPVAVALSGGIDSSAVAAAAVDAFGADNIRAFTYEFDDPSHATELRWARLVARRLGIRRHESFKIDFKDFIEAIPEHIWRSESAVHWPKAFLLPVARHLAERGFSSYLTGFGIGSHMAYLRDLARVLPWVPFPHTTLRSWKGSLYSDWRWPELLKWIHPGLEPPHRRLYHLLLMTLEREGIIEDLPPFFPPEAGPLLRRRRDADRLEPGLAGLPLAQRLQLQCFAHLVSCIDVTRSEKASREVGVHRLAPAHFASCVPYAYFPVEPPPGVWRPERHLRPGKLLLRQAYRGVLPDEVLFRKKSWSDAVASPRWLRRGRVMMLRALPRFPEDLERLGSGYADAIRGWEPLTVHANCLSQWLFVKIFSRPRPPDEPPTWRELIGER